MSIEEGARTVMAVWQKIYKTLAAIKTGIFLLIVTGVFSAVGTLILQRPTTEIDELERTYSPTTLLWLDRFGLTDVFHTWWFATLLALVSLSIIFASIERWPNAWRFYARPYRRPEPTFRKTLPNRAEIPVVDGKSGLEAAARAFSKVGIRTERIVENDTPSLYAERHRFSVMAVYVVHLSLLMILAGYIIDLSFGYRGFMQIVKGTSTDAYSLRVRNEEVTRHLPFAVRCDDTGQENYQDGTPKKWWSKLTIVENGRDVAHKEIKVNDPFTYNGMRFYQSSFGPSGDLEFVELKAAKPENLTNPVTVKLKVNETVPVDADTTVKLAKFIPDFFIQDQEVFKKSDNLVNPAFQLVVTYKGKEAKTWLMPAVQNITDAAGMPYVFTYANLGMLNYTGLQVSHLPGQWGIWAGVVLMAVGLGVAFYMVHMRFWAIAVNDPNQGWTIWVGGACNKNKERFEERFNALVEAIRNEVGELPAVTAPKPAKREKETVGV